MIFALTQVVLGTRMRVIRTLAPNGGCEMASSLIRAHYAERTRRHRLNAVSLHERPFRPSCNYFRRRRVRR